MALASSPLTSLSEMQRAQALERLTIIRPALEKQITQAEVARTHHLSLRTVQRWIKNYREQGLVGLADAVRADKGTSGKLPQAAIHLIEGLALQTLPARPPPSTARWKPSPVNRAGNPPAMGVSVGSSSTSIPHS